MSILQPPAFWDNLQTIYLSSGALREAARRYYQPPLPKESFPDISRSATEILASYSPRDLQRLRRFSRRGGPDFSEIRFCSFPEAYIPTMEPPESQGRPDATARVTTYEPNFMRHMEANHIYPPDHIHPGGREVEEPANMSAIVEMLAQDRPSSPQVTKEEFQEFVRGWRNISSGKGSNDLRKYFTQVLELGGSEDSKCEVGFVFKDLAPMADSTGDVNPYRVAGAQPESLDTGIRGKLSKHIHPSNKHELIAPNFFLEVKAADGTSEMTLKGRVCYEGAIGARAMQTLRTYEQEKEQPVFDHNAYTISVTLHDGVLNLYTHHVTDGEPRRYTTIRVAEYPMRFGQEHFQKGITAYRNARDWAKKQRDELIVAANSREREGSRQQAAGSHVTPQDDATPDELGEKTQELDQGEAGTDATPEEDLAAPDELENGEKTQPSTTTAPASEPARSQGNVSGRKRRSDAGSEADRNKKARSI